MKESAPLGFRGRARQSLAAILNHALEEEVMLSATMRSFLGNVRGPNFHSLYRLFGEQCRQIDRWLAEIGERARAFGGGARVETETFTALATEAKRASTGLPTRSMLQELLAVHEGIAARLRADLSGCGDDAGLGDFLARLVEFHETTAWMLRVVLGGPEVPLRSA